ncbi:MAG: SAF domain-containing protein, partial [Mycobacteriales bacterium]
MRGAAVRGAAVRGSGLSGSAAKGAGGKGLAPRDLQRAVARHRTLLAAGLAAAAVAAGLTAVAPAREPTVLVLTATRDLAAGAALTPDDLVATSMPPGLVPAGALTEVVGAVGRFVAGPVRRGEPLTDVRLLGAGLLGDAAAGAGGAGAAGA